MHHNLFKIALLAIALASSGCQRDRLAGYKQLDDAPWCMATESTKSLVCQSFSEKHCEAQITAAMRTGDRFTDPLCVPNPGR